MRHMFDEDILLEKVIHREVKSESGENVEKVRV